MVLRVKAAKRKLEELSHAFVRRRDSTVDEGYGGKCFDCKNVVYGQHFQAGHFEPSGSCGARLRYHPHNMHGQASGCNMKLQQEKVKIAYTIAMIDKYGREYVDKLRAYKNKTIDADIIFYETMVDLYRKGDEDLIVEYLESL